MKKFVSRFVFVWALALGVSTLGFAQEMKKDEAMMKKDEAMMAMKFDKTLPIVAVIKADWCGYCKAVEPVMMGLMEDYKGKVNFVVFDVTDEATSAKAMKTAKELGLSKFFNANKAKTSTVAVLSQKKKVLYKTSNNTNRDQYVRQFDKALN